MTFFSHIRLSHTGLFAVQLWIYCVTHRRMESGDPLTMVSMYGALSLFLAFVIVHLIRRSEPIRIRLAYDAAAAASMALCSFVITMPVDVEVARVAAAALGGVGVGWAYMRWSQFYAGEPTGYAVPLGLLSMAMGAASKLVVDLLPSVPAVAVLMVAPFATFAMLRHAIRTKDECLPAASDSMTDAGGGPASAMSRQKIVSCVRLGAGVAVYSVMVGVIQSVWLDSPAFFEPLVAIVHHGVEVLLVCALLVWMRARHSLISFEATWRIMVILMATALLFAPIANPFWGEYMLILVRVAQTLLIVVLFLALCDIARRLCVDPMLAFAVGWILYALPFALGKAVGNAIAGAGHDISFAMAVLAWAFAVVTLFGKADSPAGVGVFSIPAASPAAASASGDARSEEQASPVSSSGGAGAQISPATGGENTAGLALQSEDVASAYGAEAMGPFEGRVVADRLVMLCDALAEEYGLTPREREIAELIARGRSKAYIAETRFISENTVRGHVKRLYAKLDVHSKQELVDFIESMGSRVHRR